MRNTVIVVLFFAFQTIFANSGVVSPEEEDRIIAEEIAAGRMVEIVPGEQTHALQLPASFDRSLDKAFPEIGRQKGNSCTGWATTHYQATYQVAKREGWDAAKGGKAYWCSPHWTYNFINGGADKGGSMSNNNEVLIKHGVATWEEFEIGTPNRATSWCDDPKVWRNAINYRFKSKSTISNINTKDGLQTLKEYLYDEKYGITFSTNSPSSGKHWVWINIKDDSSTPDDDSFVGQKACYYVKENNGGRHALAVIGWNDDIWIDVNKNGKIDTGEKGALKISESHGTGAGNNGYYWLAYDALHEKSQVTGGVTEKRAPAFLSRRVYVCEIRESYTPQLLAEFTLHTAARIDVVIEFLRVEKGEIAPFKNPKDAWKGYVFGTMSKSSGNRLGFDGKNYSSDPKGAPEGTFIFDLTDILPSGNEEGEWRYVMSVTDRTAGMPVTVKSFKVISLVRNDSIFVSKQTPLTVDNDDAFAWVNVPIAPTSTVVNKDIQNNSILNIRKKTDESVMFDIRTVLNGDFSLQIFTLSGKKIWEHIEYNAFPGNYHIRWNCNSQMTDANGLYLVSLKNNNTIKTKKISLVK